MSAPADLDLGAVTIWLFLRLPFGHGVIIFTALGPPLGQRWLGTHRARDGIGARMFWCGRLHIELIWDAEYLPRDLR